MKNGTSVLFWSDLWKDERLETQFPRIFSFALDKMQSVKEFMTVQNRLHAFFLPLSVEAHSEFLQLQVELQEVTIVEEEHDIWVSTLNKAGVFRPRDVYRHHYK